MTLDPWMVVALGACGVLLLWLLLNAKKSRSDGTLLKVHPFREMMTYIMPSRNESVVYFDDWVRADRLLEYLEQANERFTCDVTHALVGATMLSFTVNPKMNRFVMGRRLYQRNKTSVTFSMKRKRLGRDAKLAAVKMDAVPGETFQGLCERIGAKINVERSDKKTYTDKETSLFVLIPRMVLTRMVSLFKWLDYYNLLPASFIENDAMYTSTFIANLGSLKMGAGFHHLYEWGNCPLFLMAGRIEERPVVENGEVVVRKMMHIRWTYDERIDDGLNSRFGIRAVNVILSDPYKYLGCLAEDGSDAYDLGDDQNAPSPSELDPDYDPFAHIDDDRDHVVVKKAS